MPISAKLLASARAHRSMKGKNPSPTANAVGEKGGGEMDTMKPEAAKIQADGATGAYGSTADAGESTEASEKGPAYHAEKALHHLKEVKARSKGALAVHAKLAAHHHRAYCKAMGH